MAPMMVEPFQPGKLVWAFYDNYPPWPAKIISPPATKEERLKLFGVGKITSTQRIVSFINDNNNCALLPISSIIPYKPNLADGFYQRAPVGDRDCLKGAIEIADDEFDLLKDPVYRPRRCNLRKQRISFFSGQLVLAKYMEYPWWPGTILDL